MRKHQLARAICEDQVGVAQVMLDEGKAREYLANLKGKTLVCYRCEKKGNTGLFRGDFQICKHCGYMSPLYYDTVLPERSSISMLLHATWLFGFRPERPFVQRALRESRAHQGLKSGSHARTKQLRSYEALAEIGELVWDVADLRPAADRMGEVFFIPEVARG